MDRLLFSAKLKSHLALWTAVIVPLFALTPSAIFARNFADFNLSLFDLSKQLLPLIPLVIAASVITAILPLQALIEVTLLWLAVALYVQGNLLNWNYGRFDGTEIPWEALTVRGWVDLTVWLGTAVIFLLLRDSLRKNLVVIACGVVLLPLFNTTTAVVSSSATLKAPIAESQATTSPSATFAFSRDKNVLMVLFDEFSSRAFYTMLEIDPSLKTELAGFTFYRDLLATFPTTYAAVPAILTGQPIPDGGSIAKYFEAVSPSALPTQLAAQGWASDIATFHPFRKHLKESRTQSLNQTYLSDRSLATWQEVLKLLDVSLFKHAPHHLKRRIFNGDKWLLQHDGKKKVGVNHYESLRFVETLEANISATSAAPTFKFFHLLIPHAPYHLSAACELDERTRREQRKYLNNAACAVGLMQRIIEKLKQHAVYDNTTIVFLSDHGSPVTFDPRAFPHKPPPMVHRAFPLLLVKPAGDHTPALVIDERPLSHLDILGLIGEVAQLPLAIPNAPRRTPDGSRRFNNYPWAHENWTSDTLPPITAFDVRDDSWDYRNWTIVSDPH